MNTNNTDPHLALRSEKVRRVVGQIPPVLVRYGTSIAVLAIAAMLVVAAFLPYRQVLRGTATVHTVADTLAPDTLLVAVSLRFDAPVAISQGQATSGVAFSTYSGQSIRGHLLSLSPNPDTLGRQSAYVALPSTNIDALLHSQCAFALTLERGTLLRSLMGR